MANDKQKVGNIRGPAPWTTPVAWAADTQYGAKAPAAAVKRPDGVYVCVTSHRSGSEFDPANWVKILEVAQAVPGPRGASVFSGNGPPSAEIVGQAIAGLDSYVDLASGDTYSFT